MVNELAADLHCCLEVKKGTVLHPFVPNLDSITCLVRWRRRAFPFRPIDGLDVKTCGKYLSRTYEDRLVVNQGKLCTWTHLPHASEKNMQHQYVIAQRS